MRANFLVQSALVSIVSVAMASAWSANRRQYYQPSASDKSFSGRLADNFKQTLSVDMDKLYDGKKMENTVLLSLFVFMISGPKQNARSLLTPVSDTVFMLFHMVPSVLLSMVALITTYFKESDWLLKNLHH